MNFLNKAKELAGSALEAASDVANSAKEKAGNIEMGNISSYLDTAKEAALSAKDKAMSYVPGKKANIIEDIEALHEKMTHGPGARAMDTATLREYFNLRLKMLDEEYRETVDAIAAGDCEEIVDGMIDQVVVLVGTLDLMGVDVSKAWTAVNDANMAKNPGVKEGRPNPFGLQDMIKPEGWVAPSHAGNHGRLSEIFKN